MIAPWTNFWTGNVFVQAYPALQDTLASPFMRGAVSGIGVVTTLAGIVELASAILLRHRDGPPAPTPGV